MRVRGLIPFLFLGCLACGGAQEEPTTPDESGDLDITSRARRTSEMPPGLDGTRWRWVEAHCTEGPLDLLARGYAATLRAHEEDGGLTLVSDQQFATEGCQHTIVQRAVPPEQGPDWQMEEVARVAVPATDACYGRPEPPRPGEVRVRDGRLEVLVQRSQWCNGLEVRMVYERASDALLEDDELVRRYVAHFTRGDADALAALFAETGSLLEPFTRTETGDPYRHDGRAAVERWFADTFQTAPWRAMRITEMSEASSSEAGTTQQVVRWEYMDPRLEEPFTGVTRFTIAAGEIFEASIELTSEPTVREGAGAEDEPAEG
jgi:ketosteroid isomerase-like protein